MRFAAGYNVISIVIQKAARLRPVLFCLNEKEKKGGVEINLLNPLYLFYALILKGFKLLCIVLQLLAELNAMDLCYRKTNANLLFPLL